METTPRTRLAILGTLFDLHRELLPYDLAALRQLVVELAPEILCAEITRGTWEAGDLTSAEVEVREALAPVVAVTDTVLVPVAPTEHQFLDFAPRAGWRWSLVRALERLLRWGQRGAGTPEAVNGFLFGAFCHTLCWLIERLCSLSTRTISCPQGQLSRGQYRHCAFGASLWLQDRNLWVGRVGGCWIRLLWLTPGQRLRCPSQSAHGDTWKNDWGRSRCRNTCWEAHISPLV